MKNKFVQLLILLILQSCSNTNQNVSFKYSYNEGVEICKGFDKKKYSIPNEVDFLSTPFFYLDSSSQIFYFNNFNISIIAIDIKSFKELGNFQLKENNKYPIVENSRFEITKNRNKIILRSNRNLWFFDSNLTILYANYIDSIRKFDKKINLGNWDYKLENDSIKIYTNSNKLLYSNQLVH